MVDFMTPYAVDGSVIPGAGLRRHLHNSTSGAAGVVRPGDLKITALNTPGPGVQVAAGDDLVPCRAPGRERETYGVPLSAAQDYMGDSGEGLPGTGSSGGRRDMIIHEITDPSLPRTYTPSTEIPEGVYSKISVVPGVPSGAKTVADVPALNDVTCYALAAINYPASTATIQNAMIEDLREVAQPNIRTDVREYSLEPDDGDPAITNTTVDGQTWPQRVDSAWADVPIPEWATHVRVVMTWNGVRVPAGNSGGRIWVQLAPLAHPDNRRTQHIAWDTDNTNVSRETYRATGTIAIPEGLRGTSQRFYPRAYRTHGTTAQAPRLTASSSIDLLVEFTERAV